MHLLMQEAVSRQAGRDAPCEKGQEHTILGSLPAEAEDAMVLLARQNSQQVAFRNHMHFLKRI